MSSTGSRPNHLKTLWHLTMSKVKGDSHQERLESFYDGQADGYDDFRKRLLHGREEMLQSIDYPEQGVWVDLGAGTGANAEFISETLPKLKSVYQVDLCSPLLEVANRRVSDRGWTNVKPTHGDATKFLPEEGYADVVTCSYSLTMIPDWFATIDNAIRMLKPGGTFGVVDFFVSRKYPQDGHVKHGWLPRTFWQTWFGLDNVFLNPDHIPYLTSQLETIKLEQRWGKVPYLPLMKAPHYIFLGRKPE